MFYTGCGTLFLILRKGQNGGAEKNICTDERGSNMITENIT